MTINVDVQSRVVPRKKWIVGDSNDSNKLGFFYLTTRMAVTKGQPFLAQWPTKTAHSVQIFFFRHEVHLNVAATSYSTQNRPGSVHSDGSQIQPHKFPSDFCNL